jgi:hypothetical protein
LLFDASKAAGHGGFYIQASGVSVTLPAAGYDYNSDWTYMRIRPSRDISAVLSEILSYIRNSLRF